MFQAVNRLINTWLQPGDWSRKIVSAASAASQSANKLLKQLVPIHAADTGLKPGANEKWYLAVLLFALTITSHASTNNYALNRPVTVSSTYQANYGSNAVDAVVSDSSRWLGNPAGGGNWLEINFTTNVTLAQAHRLSDAEWKLDHKHPVAGVERCDVDEHPRQRNHEQ